MGRCGGVMNNNAITVILNIVGLAITLWGVTMLMDNHPIFIPAAVNAITYGGLIVLLVSTILLARHTFPEISLIAVPLIAISYLPRIHLFSRNNNNSQHEDQPEKIEPENKYGNLISAMSDLRYSATELAEKRRELYHLNVKQWHYDHKEETQYEIAAAKKYRSAKSNLFQHRELSPNQFTVPIDSFCSGIEQCLNDETYTDPEESHLTEKMADIWDSANHQLIAAARLIKE
tara:strand:- start:8388 stop:9083 length:696 start_codon:yes stop_codon:yes gene_type:complete